MVNVSATSTAAMIAATRTTSDSAAVAAAPPVAATTEGTATDPRPVSLSSEAAAVVLQQQNQPTPEAKPHIVWQTFITVREGFSNYDTAAGVDNPGYVSNSAGLDDAQLTRDVRARMSANIQKMADSGEAYGARPFEGTDYNSMLSGLDPRSLTLVRDSKGDMFSEDERLAARVVLDMQQGTNGKGMASVPSRLMPLYLSKGLGPLPDAARNDALAHFNGELNADPNSVPNKISQASMRVLLGDAKSNTLFGAVPPEDKMLALLVDTLKQAHAKDSHVLEKASSVRDLDDLRKQDWFQPAVDKFNAILAEQAAPRQAGEIGAAAAVAQAAA